MFSLERIIEFYLKWRSVPWLHEELKTIKEAREFYEHWLFLVEQLIHNGYDNEEQELYMASQKLRVVLLNPPEKISYKYPFVNNGRDIVDMLDMVSFFKLLKSICDRKENEAMN